jgi:hypothetical protein
MLVLVFGLQGKGAKSLFRLSVFAVLYRKVAHFWQSFSASVFSVCSRENRVWREKAQAVGPSAVRGHKGIFIIGGERSS